MNQEKHAKVARAGMVASIATAFGASICCIGPIVAVMFGVTSLAGLAKYEPLRPLFSGVTIVLLGFAFYATYRRPAAACESGSVCATRGVDRVQRINRIVLWLASAAAVVVLTFPTWSGWLLG